MKSGTAHDFDSQPAGKMFQFQFPEAANKQGHFETDVGNPSHSIGPSSCHETDRFNSDPVSEGN